MTDDYGLKHKMVHNHPLPVFLGRIQEDVISPRKSLSLSEPSTRTSFSSRLLQGNSIAPVAVHEGGLPQQEQMLHDYHQQQLLNGACNRNSTGRSISMSIVDLQQSLHGSSVVPGNLSKQDLNGLNIAGIAVTLLTTIFTFFHPMYIVHMMASDTGTQTSKSHGSENDVIEEAFVSEQREEQLVFKEQSHNGNQSHKHHTTIQKLVVYCVIIPGLVVLLSWIIDHWSQIQGHKRTDLVSASGCIFAISFMIPFLVPLFIPNSSYGYILSTSFFDLAYAFTVIVLGSAFIDCQNLTTRGRIAFMSSSEVMYLIVSLMTCQFGLPHFYQAENNSDISPKLKHDNDTLVDGNNQRGDGDDGRRLDAISGFARFLFVMQCLACLLFLVAQRFFASNGSTGIRNRRFSHHILNHNNYHRDIETSVDGLLGLTLPAKSSTPGNISYSSMVDILDQHLTRVRHTIWEIWNQRNYCIWVVMESLSKAQSSFSSYFLYLLMGRLVAGQTDSIFHHHFASSTTFSSFGTIFIVAISKQIGTIIAYVPIAMFGYRQVYQHLVEVSIALSGLMLAVADPTSELWIVGYVFIHITMTRAAQSAGMYLVMVDLVTEMRHKHLVLEHRHNEPSPAAFFLGLNAFFVKPTRIVFAVVAEAVSMHINSKYGSSDSTLFASDDSKRELFYFLIFTTTFCSFLQIIAWKHYDLGPNRVLKLREEIKLTRDHQFRNKRSSDIQLLLNQSGADHCVAPTRSTHSNNIRQG